MSYIKLCVRSKSYIYHKVVREVNLFFIYNEKLMVKYEDTPNITEQGTNGESDSSSDDESDIKAIQTHSKKKVKNLCKIALVRSKF